MGAEASDWRWRGTTAAWETPVGDEVHLRALAFPTEGRQLEEVITLERVAEESRLVERLITYRRPLIVLAHAALVIAAYVSAFLIRFDFNIPSGHWETLLITLPILLAVRLITFGRFHLYQGMWRYVGLRDIQSIISAVSVGSIAFAAVTMTIFSYADLGDGFPRSVLVLDWMLSIMLVAGIRIGIREMRELTAEESDSRERAIIAGAGDAGQSLLRYLQQSPYLDYTIVGLLDDDPRKRRARLHGVPILGRIDDLSEAAASVNATEVILALPSVSGDERRRVLKKCLEAKLPVKTVPSYDDLEQGRARIGQLQAVDPQDLLPREAVPVDFERLLDEIGGRRVMVTGAAGSIGSELARQIATLNPEMLILFEQAESPLYFVDIELRELHPELKTVPIVGDILDRAKVREVMAEYSPEVVYHAAAYKHVPLMEAQPLEAIQNNLFGTEVVATEAIDAGVRKFVNISTDKAVRPVGVMGMTKRVGEDLLITLDGEKTTFVSVRFGNVLGSAGSVIPLFQKQIARGGPVTVTDPEATRYFMIIAEAAQLVLQAGAMGEGGEVFFLDMGEPMRIGDLADNLIRLAGMSPGVDVEVTSMGLRPGERMDEELVRETEELLRSDHEKVFHAQSPTYDKKAFATDYEHLRQLVLRRDVEGAKAQLKLMAGRF